MSSTSFLISTRQTRVPSLAPWQPHTHTHIPCIRNLSEEIWWRRVWKHFKIKFKFKTQQQVGGRGWRWVTRVNWLSEKLLKFSWDDKGLFLVRRLLWLEVPVGCIEETRRTKDSPALPRNNMWLEFNYFVGKRFFEWKSSKWKSYYPQNITLNSFTLEIVKEKFIIQAEQEKFIHFLLKFFWET